MTAATPQPAATAPESATTALYRSALGPVNTAHYLDVFARFDEAGRASPVWNGAAGWLTLNWMVFRQLWGSALVYLACAEGLALLAIGLGRYVLQWPQAIEWGVMGALALLSIAIPGAYGNALLHADTRRRMTRAVSQARTVREACAALEKQASSRRRLWVLVVINVLLVAAAGGAYLAMDARGRTWASDMLGIAPAAVAPAAVTESLPETAPMPPMPPMPPVGAAPAGADVISEPPPEPAPVTLSLPVSLPESGPAEVQAAAPAPEASAPLMAPSPVPASSPVDAAPQAHGINVGLFADRANADRALAQLIEAGFPAILQDIDHPRGKLTRVRVGPFTSRAQANEAAARIRALGLEAVVFQP